MNPFSTLARADRQLSALRSVKKANPSQALGGIYIPPGVNTVVDTGKLSADTLIADGFKRNVYAYTCVDRLATMASRAVWKVETRIGDSDEWEPEPKDWRNALLAYPMADKMAAEEVYYYFGAWLLIKGNGILRKTLGGTNGVIELIPMTPKNMQPVASGADWISGYNIIEDGRVVWSKPAEEIIHARFPDPSNPLWGFGPLEAAWQSVLSDNASAEWRKTSMQSGGVPPVAIIDEELDGTQAQEQAAALRLAFRRNAIDRSPMLMGGKKTVESFGYSPADMEIPEDRQLTKADIVSAFGMHPSVVDSQAATFDNMDAGIRYTYENGVLKVLCAMREALNLGLLTQEERESDSVYINFDLAQIPFFRRQREAKIANMGVALRSGISRNDYVIMSDLGLEKVEGGDAVFIESGLVLLSEAAEGVASGSEVDPSAPPFPPMPNANPAEAQSRDLPANEDAPPA